MPYSEAANANMEADARSALEVAPGHLLRQAKRLLEQAEKLVEQAVVAERIKGTSWDVIGDVLGGVTKSAAQKRYGTRVERWKVNQPDLQSALGNSGLPRSVIELGLAYGGLKEGWKAAGEIVVAQGLLAELTNATTALSGGGKNRRSRKKLPPSYFDGRMADLLTSRCPNDDEAWRALRNYVVHTNSERDLAHLPYWLIAVEDAETCRRLAGHLNNERAEDRTEPTDWASFNRAMATADERATTRDRWLNQWNHPQGLERRVAVLEEQVAALMAKEDGHDRPSSQP
ncbi:hypothetical protein ACFVH9_07315 [Streptomyces hirsutus]|uniref:hypothetical protein n=1 Tax=Streptomyces hirsutus TaxID=35620 RepID=UPI00363F4C19